MATNDNAQPMQASTPDPALRRLDRLVGTWELTGRTLNSEVDNISGWTTFEWLPGGFFLQSSGEITFKGFKLHSVEIIAYDPASQIFPASVYTSVSGAVLPYYWNVEGNTVTHWMDTARYSGTFSEDGKRLSGGWRPIAGQGGSDEMAYDAIMIRVDRK